MLAHSYIERSHQSLGSIPIMLVSHLFERFPETIWKTLEMLIQVNLYLHPPSCLCQAVRTPQLHQYTLLWLLAMLTLSAFLSPQVFPLPVLVGRNLFSRNCVYVHVRINLRMLNCCLANCQRCRFGVSGYRKAVECSRFWGARKSARESKCSFS